jgi:hypothetical protein
MTPTPLPMQSVTWLPGTFPKILSAPLIDQFDSPHRATAGFAVAFQFAALLAADRLAANLVSGDAQRAQPVAHCLNRACLPPQGCKRHCPDYRYGRPGSRPSCGSSLSFWRSGEALHLLHCRSSCRQRRNRLSCGPRHRRKAWVLHYPDERKTSVVARADLAPRGFSRNRSTQGEARQSRRPRGAGRLAGSNGMDQEGTTSAMHHQLEMQIGA